MQGKKPWYMSKGVWGSAGTIIVSVLGFFNIDINPENMKILVADGMVFLTGLMSLIGRIKAKNKIG